MCTQEVNEQRLLRLERSNRRLRIGLISIAMASAGICLLGATNPAPKVLKANSFVLVDAAGNERGEFSSNPKAVALQLLNQNGTRAVIIAAGSESNAVSVNDNSGETRMFLDASDKSADLGVVRDGSPKEKLLITDNDAGTELAIRDQSGHEMVDVGVSAKGPDIMISDANETVRAMMALQGFMSLDKGGNLDWASFGEKLTPEERQQVMQFINQSH